ncbi:MAG: macA 3 [Acidobacteria bacterium]|nr:macA 3 [Acidobacteriota bacterium]
MTLTSLHRTISFEASRNRRVLPSAVAAAAILALMACARPEPQAASQEAAGSPGTVRVERRNLRNTARLHGTVAAVESYTVLAPRLSGQMTGTMVITGIAPNGSRVRKGDILVEFDRQNQMKTVLDRQAEYDNLVQQIRKKQADQEAARAADETELKTAEVDLQSARVEMRKNEVVSRIQAEINKQNLAEAEARLKQVNDTLALKREAAAAELRILEIQRDRAQKAVTYAQNNIEKMTVRSQLDGLVVLTPIYKGTRMVDPQEGDEVRPGGGIMLVVDPSAMQVVARLNQVDVAQVRAGMNTEVRLDAYPDLVFPGIVDRISAIGTSSQYSKRIRYFAAVISIRGSHPKLLPDLTAAVDVELEGSEDVLLLPREAVAAQNGQSVVRILTDGRTELRPVKTGPMNELEVVIESGLEEGMTVSRNPNSGAGAAVRQPD